MDKHSFNKKEIILYWGFPLSDLKNPLRISNLSLAVKNAQLRFNVDMFVYSRTLFRKNLPNGERYLGNACRGSKYILYWSGVMKLLMTTRNDISYAFRRVLCQRSYDLLSDFIYVEEEDLSNLPLPKCLIDRVAPEQDVQMQKDLIIVKETFEKIISVGFDLRKAA